jgi:hypothetical protein
MVNGSYQHKRRFERFRADQLNIDCIISGQEKGCLRDISIGGASVCSEKNLEVGTRCVLGVSTSKGLFEIPAEVVWSQKAQAATCLDSRLPSPIGLRFDKEFIESSKDLVFELLN